MLEQQGNALTFDCFYQDTTGIGVTGLTVTCDVYEGTSLIVTGASATEVGGGFYTYTLSSGSVDANAHYRAIFKTSSSSVAAKWLPALWVVGRAWVNHIDADISSILTGVTQGVSSISGGLSGSVVTARRGDGWNLTLTTNSFTWAASGKLDIAIKSANYAQEADADAILWVRMNYGSAAAIQRLNGSTSGFTGTDATITVNSSTSITITVQDAVTAQIAPSSRYRFDVQHIPSGGDANTIAEGVFAITADVVQAVS